MTQDPLELALDNANKVLTTNIPELTFEERLKANDKELIRSLVTAMNASMIVREAISHGAVVINDSMRLYIERNPNSKPTSKKYKYLLNKIKEFDKLFISMVKTTEKTLGVSSLQEGFDEVASTIYSDMYEEVRIEDKE